MYFFHCNVFDFNDIHVLFSYTLLHGHTDIVFGSKTFRLRAMHLLEDLAQQHHCYTVQRGVYLKLNVLKGHLDLHYVPVQTLPQHHWAIHIHSAPLPILQVHSFLNILPCFYLFCNAINKNAQVK